MCSSMANDTNSLVPGTACFLGPDVVHEIFNDTDEDLVQLWVIGPAGLEDFFKTIGRDRTRGDATPENFDRLNDVVAIERDMGFNKTTASWRADPGAAAGS